MYSYFYVAKMRAQNYAEVVVTPYIQEMAIKSYPFMYEAYNVMKTLATLLVAICKAILLKLREWMIALTAVVVKIAKAIKWHEIRTTL